MSERSLNWTACAIGIGLFGAMLGGCRTHPAPVISFVPPMPVSATAVSAEENEEHPQSEPDDGSKAAIAENLQNGDVEESRGRPAQAAEYYERILRIDSRHAEAHRRLARIAAADQDFRQAERHLRVALETYPESRELWTELARCCAAQNRPRDARRALQRAVGAENPERAGSVSPQPVFAARDDPPGRIHLAPLPPRGEEIHQPPTIIVRTARATSEHPTRTSVDNPQPHKLPLLPRPFVRQARARPGNASSDAIHLVSMMPDEMIQDAAVPGTVAPQDSGTTIPDGNLPLWEADGSLKIED